MCGFYDSIWKVTTGLPLTLRSQPEMSAFKSNLKTYLFSQAVTIYFSFGHIYSTVIVSFLSRYQRFIRFIIIINSLKPVLIWLKPQKSKIHKAYEIDKVSMRGSQIQAFFSKYRPLYIGYQHHHQNKVTTGITSSQNPVMKWSPNRCQNDNGTIQAKTTHSKKKKKKEHKLTKLASLQDPHPFWF